MGIGEEIKKMAEDIISSHEMRASALGSLVAETKGILGNARGMVKDFADERRKKAAELAEELGNFAKGLADGVGNMLKDFQEKHQEMSEEQKKELTDFISEVSKDVSNLLKDTQGMLKDFQKERKEMAADLQDRLNQGREDLRKYMASKLKELNESHSQMSVALRDDLAKYVGNIVQGVQDFLGDFSSQLKEGRAALDRISSVVSKTAGAAMPRVAGKAEVTTVEKAVEAKKSPKKSSKKKKK